MENKIRNSLIRTIMLAILFVGTITFISIKYSSFIFSIISSTDTFRDFILSYGNSGVLVFLSFQFIHIIIPFIPGEFIQIAGGYVYGTLLGSILIFFGTLVGTILAFYASRTIGYPLVKIFVSKERIEKFTSLTNSEKVGAVMFILFLIPGVPKDALIYLAGLTPIKPLRFIVLSLVARSPGLIGSAFIGSNLHEKDYKSIIILSAVSVTLFLIGIFFRKKLFIKF